MEVRQGTRHDCERRRRRITGRILGRAIILALVAMAAGPVASAVATVSIEIPLGETATNNPQPSFEGHTSDSVDPVTLDIYEGFPASGAPVQAPTTLPVVGTWSLTLASPLADGIYTAVAEQGPTQLSAPVEFTVKTAAPKVSIAPLSSPTNDATPTLEGAGGEAPGDNPTVAVTIYQGSLPTGTVAASGSAPVIAGAWSYVSSHLADGTYTAQATQGDKAGNTGTSSAVTFTVKTAAPKVSIAPLSSPTNDATPTLEGAGGEAPGDNPTVAVTIYQGSLPTGTVAASGSAPVIAGAWSYVSSHLADGTYTAQATQGDKAGNTGTSSAVTFTVKTAAPKVSIAPLSSPTNDATPTLEGAGGEAPGDNPTVAVTIYQGSLPTGTVAASGSAPVIAGAWSYVSSHLADGTYTAQATQGDKAGNTGTSSAVTFTVKTAAPKVSIAPLSSPTNDATPTLEGAGGEAPGDNPTVAVTIYQGSLPTGTVAASGSAPVIAGAWSYVSSHLADGTYTAQATQGDKAGNTGTSSAVTFTVKTAAPKVSIAPLSSPTNDATPTLEGAGGEAPGDNPTVAVTIYQGSLPTGTVAASGSAPVIAGAWSYVSSHLADGTYTAQATQGDKAGNTGTSSAVTFTVKTAAPKVSIAPLSSPTNDATPTLEGAGGEAPGDNPTVAVTIYQGSLPTGTVAASGSAPVIAGAWSYVSSHLADGTYTAQATQGDKAGNTGTSSAVTFTVKTAAPKVSIAPLSSPTNDATPTLEGAGGEAPGDNPTVAVTIYQGSLPTGTVAASGSAPVIAGAWSYVSSHLADGTYTAQATQGDKAGNTGTSSAVTFTIDTTSPTVTLNPPISPSNNTTPSFSGFATDTTPVMVRIYAGATVKGSPVATATATGTGGGWTSAGASPALTEGQYTAVATQTSSLGNPPGTSEPQKFTVLTAAPKVTLNAPKSPSNNTTPSFTGTASDTTTVLVQIYAGPTTAGPIVSTAAATPAGGKWESGKASPALPSGQYTAVATQESSLLGNPAGTSSSVTFAVDTTSPTVTLSTPASLSNNTTPSFTGTASDTTAVVVHIYDAANSEVSSSTATPAGGKWTSAKVSPPLSSGSYTAVATQPSSLGNPPGMSEPRTFTVDTAPPRVVLNSPALRSNDTTPSFTGTASDTTSVTIRVYAGATATGSVVATATATPTNGSWESGKASPAVPSGQYTAVATQESSLGNPPGTSEPRIFTVDTTSPTVTLTAPKSPSNDTTPSFTGTASDTTSVTIRVYAGATATGSVVATATATPTNGSWESGKASPAVPSGQYTAVATQESSLGNPPGTSEPRTFTVDTTSPKVTLTAPKSPSNNTTPSFTGTASDTTSVTIRVYAGATATGSVVATATATPTNGSWESGKASPAVPSGQYTAVATQESSLGNPPGTSEPRTFTVDTTSPTVTLTAPESPSNNTTPSFTGTASDTTPVTIRIYDAASAEVSSATATPVGGKWKSGAVSPALSSGTHTYTATATQTSSLGNPAGTSALVRFTVDTTPPTVTLDPPASPSSDTAPSFTGSASDTTQVTVDIYTGASVKGAPIASATATGTGGKWESEKASPVLPSGKHIFTAVAIQESSLGNPAGTSPRMTFTVDSEAPTVTLSTPASLSNNTTPSFTGTASDTTPVSVEIYAGATATGSPVSMATATGTGGSWTSGNASPALSDGQYAAIATQTSLTGHKDVTGAIHFTVDTVPPHVTLTYPVNGSSTGSASQLVQGTAGTAGDDLPGVTVQLFSGSSIVSGQAPLQSVAVNAAGGAWSATLAGLSAGSYIVRAEQSDAAGNVGVSNASTFVVTAGAPAATVVQAPAASFTWFPAAPHIGEPVSLVSSSTDASSPITAFAWDRAGSGAFTAGGQAISTSFSTTGNHLVRLRVTDANGLSSVASQTIVVTPLPLRLMQPFPTVRIVTTRLASRIKLTLLAVQAPAGARITVTCGGHGCPSRFQSKVAESGKRGAAAVEFRRFERSLRVGMILWIRVSKPGEIGKYTRFSILSGRLSSRFDTCLGPAGVKPMTCPSS